TCSAYPLLVGHFRQTCFGTGTRSDSPALTCPAMLSMVGWGTQKGAVRLMGTIRLGVGSMMRISIALRITPFMTRLVLML
ncbi:MAG: hypothetical protein KKF24_06785, partial [Gammaproteobacteria bacterium]|nr:hypothetical protein [Gammaproteobacteria bacterium]MBU1832386.1 hypothetical protein [Gammaproteobacteria bacterium]